MTVGGGVWERPGEVVRRREPRPSSVRGAVWIAAYLLFILAPLFALLFGAGEKVPAQSSVTVGAN